jgi:hypothetical protein
MLSPHLGERVSSGGKYWCWADRLNPDSLEVLLWAIGELGVLYPIVGLPERPFSSDVGSDDRMRDALRGMVKIQSLEPLSREEFSLFEIAQDVSGFSWQYRERLAHGVQTAWAENLDEFRVGLLFWRVGEYGCRVKINPNGGDYSPPNFILDSPDTKRMRAALHLITRIEHREPLSMTDVPARS